MDGWNTSFLLEWCICRGYVSFKEGTIHVSCCANCFPYLWTGCEVLRSVSSRASWGVVRKSFGILHATKAIYVSGFAQRTTSISSCGTSYSWCCYWRRFATSAIGWFASTAWLVRNSVKLAGEGLGEFRCLDSWVKLWMMTQALLRAKQIHSSWHSENKHVQKKIHLYVYIYIYHVYFPFQC